VARHRGPALAEPLLGFIARERGLTRDASPEAAQTLAGRIWIAQARDSAGGAEQNFHQDRVSVFGASTDVTDGTLQVVASDPSTRRYDAVRFDARMPVQFALATKAEIEKALKKYYGVGAETLDEMGDDER